MNKIVLITLLSWEERYILGLEKNIKDFNPSKILMFRYDSNLDWNAENLTKTKELAGDRLIDLEVDSSKTIDTWFIFKQAFEKYCGQNHVVLDITTMTRELIWLSLFNCKLNKCVTDYIYYKPEGYSNDWISRDPGKPRLLYKMSGIAKLGAPSLLLITGGYDIQRLDSLIYNFEPKQTVLFFQDGDDHRNKDNFKNCQDLFRTKYGIELLYEYDAYNVDTSYNLILERLLECDENKESFLTEYNVILNSRSKNVGYYSFQYLVETPGSSIELYYITRV